jgi:hypothetical protein
MSSTSFTPVPRARSSTSSTLVRAPRSRSASAGSASQPAIPRPWGRELSGPELETFVGELADRPELWIHLVEHDATQRHYEQLLGDEHLSAWLTCWLEDHDTGFHDHDVSSGAVAVLSGAVREQRLAIESPPRARTLTAGERFHFSPADIHRVTHAGSGPAVTLHAYSPPLLRMGTYVVGEDGLLARHSMSHLEELRPLARPAG